MLISNPTPLNRYYLVTINESTIPEYPKGSIALADWQSDYDDDDHVLAYRDGEVIVLHARDITPDITPVAVIVAEVRPRR